MSGAHEALPARTCGASNRLDGRSFPVALHRVVVGAASAEASLIILDPYLARGMHTAWMLRRPRSGVVLAVGVATKMAAHLGVPLELAVGFEPTTCCLQNSCSAN